MNIKIETVTLHDGSKIEVICDIEAVRKLAEECDTYKRAFVQRSELVKHLRATIGQFVMDYYPSQTVTVEQIKKLDDSLDWYPPNNPT